MWLVDNNVPRAVTVLLRDLGADVIEVRAVLGQAATDDELAAFARATGRYVITHDVRFAQASLRAGLPHVWLRSPESRDREAVEAKLEQIVGCLEAGAARVTVRVGQIDCKGGSNASS